MKKVLIIILVAMVFTLPACERNNQKKETNVNGLPKEEQQSENLSSNSEGITETSKTENTNNDKEIQIKSNEIKQQEVANKASDTKIELPILDEINKNIMVGTAGSSLKAVSVVVKLLDWGTTTGLDPQEIKKATVEWLSNKGNDEQVEFAEKMELVDSVYKELLGDGAKDLLSSAGCEDAGYPWSDTLVESIEAIMEAVGLR